MDEIKNQLPPPTPGVYPGTDMGIYHSWDAASQSRLARLIRSPAHLRAYIAQPPADTPALLLGRAIHCAVLEPEVFDERFTLAEQCMATTGKGNRCSNPGVWLHRNLGWVCGVHVKGNEIGVLPSAATVLSEDDHRACLGVRDSVNASHTAKGLITGPGQVELSMVWDDQESGCACKARWDRFSPELPGGAVVDLKSTRGASRAEFERTIFTFGYHMQGAHYLAGGKARKLPARHYCILAIEKEPPFAVGCYRLTEGAILAGEELLRPLLNLYARLCDIPPEEWGAYPDEVLDIGLPDWAWKVSDERVRELEQAVA